MTGKPVELSRDAFLAAIAETNAIPRLVPEIAGLLGVEGFRATQSGLLPYGEVQALVWNDGLCLLSKQLFAELAAAKRSLGLEL